LANSLSTERSPDSKRTNHRRWEVPVTLRLWHLASVDAPTVAVVWMLSFAWAAEVRVDPWVPLLLALAAWALYVGDRLMDARAGLKTGDTAKLRQRHCFHWRHRGILAPLAVAAAYGAACIVFVLMPAAARERNTVLAAAAAVYFTRVHSGGKSSSFLPQEQARFPWKELLVAVLFTSACALPVLSRLSTVAARGPLMVSAGFFALLAWLNCYAIEYWENATGEESAGWFDGLTRPFALACALSLAGLILAAEVRQIESRVAELIVAGASSALLLGLLDRLRSRMTGLALRTVADVVLLSPAFLALPGMIFRILPHR
jgi:hypothetical protein